jgi:PAS domain S-box-containing protein
VPPLMRRRYQGVRTLLKTNYEAPNQMNVMESHLKSNDLVMKAFMQSTPQLKWIADQQENLVYANQAFFDYFNLDRSVIHKNFNQIFPKDIAAVFLSTHARVRAEKKPVNAKIQSHKTDGSPLSLIIKSFVINGVVNPALVAGEAMESNKETKTNEQVLTHEQLPGYQLRPTSESVWEWDITSGHIYRNQQLQELIGFTLDKKNDLSWWFNRIHIDDRERVQHSIAQTLENKSTSWEEEYNFQCADGTYKFIHDRAVVMYENGWPVKMIGSLQDVTELRQLRNQLLQEKLVHQREIAESIINAQEKERMHLANELHDNVNQILTTARLYLEMMNPENPQEKDFRDKTHEFVSLAYNEIRKLSKELVSPQLKAVTITKGIQDLIHDIDPAGSFQITFDHDPTIWVSQNLKITLFRIVQEQLKNIIHYSKARKINIEMKSAGNAIFLKISDDGIGFNPNHSRQGIGMNNIHERVQLYGGTLDVDTAPGQGCRVTIIIPL